MFVSVPPGENERQRIYDSGVYDVCKKISEMIEEKIAHAVLHESDAEDDLRVVDGNQLLVILGLQYDK
jgi:DNA-binding cell septation regulator SpoVG